MLTTAKKIKLYYAAFLLIFLGVFFLWASVFVDGSDVVYTRFAFVIIGLSSLASAYGFLRRVRWLTLSISALFVSLALSIVLAMLETSDYPPYLPVLLGPIALFWWLAAKGAKKITGQNI